MQVLLTIADARKASRIFKGVFSTYPARLVEIPKLGPRLPARSLVMIDFLGATTEHLRHLKAVSEGSDNSMVGIVDLRNRQQVMQARELGCRELMDRSEHLSTVLAKLRKRLGNYARPRIAGRCSERMAETVTSACSSYAELTAAALENSPLPLPKLESNARDIANTIEAEGLNAWLSAVQLHHSHTFCHTMMVTGHATHFSKVLGMSTDDQALLGLSALVHDLGKVKIPLSILDKPGKLTPSERQLVNKHPVYSREILKDSTGVPADVYEIAVSHHEYLDGTGYPDGLSGSRISQYVRIITICDIFSALTEKRAYKDSMSPRQAFAIMFDMKGKLDDGLLRSFRDSQLGNELGQLRRKAV